MLEYGDIVTARRYASAAFAAVVCPSARPSVRMSQTGNVSKRLDESSWVLARWLFFLSHTAFGYLQK